MGSAAQLIDECHQALVYLIPVLDRLPKPRRNSLAQQLEQHMLKLLVLLSQAMYAAERKLLLEQANQELIAIRHLWRLCYELKLINADRYGYFCEFLQSVGLQLGGWLKHAKR